MKVTARGETSSRDVVLAYVRDVGTVVHAVNTRPSHYMVLVSTDPQVQPVIVREDDVDVRGGCCQVSTAKLDVRIRTTSCPSFCLTLTVSRRLVRPDHQPS
jgi:hypothetical protein